MSVSILIIDDDSAIRELLKMLLSDEGYEIVEIENLSGIEPILTVKPDLIILDMKMPKISGAELSQMLKNHPQTRSIPLLGLSGSSEREAMSLHCNAFVSKPFDVDNLLEQIQLLLEPNPSRLGMLAG
ncbi:MAG: response regulator [Chloroflexota bacterium]